MFSDFDRGVDRRGTASEKWDDNLNVFGREDVLPLWVADMDFQAPKPVVDALTARAAHGIYGYNIFDPEDNLAVINWMATRHNLHIKESEIRQSPGVVLSMLYALNAVCEKGDPVAIMTPVYGPFYRMPERAGMTLVKCPLIENNNVYTMDLELFERQCKDGLKALLFCSPHNPVGRVWTLAELTALVQICNRYNVRIIADEIHMDLVMPGHAHTPILNVPGAEKAILLASATKTFNLAGLRHSSILVKDQDTLDQIDKVMSACAVGEPNIFGALAQRIAYEQGAPWLDSLIEYVSGSAQFVIDYLAAHLPEILPAELQGTYLMWLDCRQLGLPDVWRFLIDEAGVGLNNGESFGEAGKGFVRLNLATPRSNIKTALEQIERAVRAR